MFFIPLILAILDTFLIVKLFGWILGAVFLMVYCACLLFALWILIEILGG